jgi:hypothetical protein
MNHSPLIDITRAVALCAAMSPRATNRPVVTHIDRLLIMRFLSSMLVPGTTIQQSLAVNAPLV